MSELAQKSCSSCSAGDKLSNTQTQKLMSELSGWELHEQKYLEKSFATDNFLQALSIVESVARLAEQENHHPDISFGWGYARLRLWTHTANGLSENDFILAAKIDQLESDEVLE